MSKRKQLTDAELAAAADMDARVAELSAKMGKTFGVTKDGKKVARPTELLAPRVESSLPLIPREQFELMLETAITNAQMALEAAKGLSFLGCSARDIARQRRMNQMVENQVIAIEEMSDVIVACSRGEELNHVPYPPVIDRDRSLLNYTNRLGCRPAKPSPERGE